MNSIALCNFGGLGVFSCQLLLSFGSLVTTAFLKRRTFLREVLAYIFIWSIVCVRWIWTNLCFCSSSNATWENLTQQSSFLRYSADILTPLSCFWASLIPEPQSGSGPTTEFLFLVIISCPKFTDYWISWSKFNLFFEKESFYFTFFFLKFRDKRNKGKHKNPKLRHNLWQKILNFQSLYLWTLRNYAVSLTSAFITSKPEKTVSALWDWWEG
jgi:hypothetical protein